MLSEETKVIQKFKPFKLGFCACGCGAEIKIKAFNNIHLIKFVRNHHFRLDKNKRNQWGENNTSWKGGRYLHKSSGHWYVLRPDNKHADKNGYVGEHVIVFEEYYNCCMLPWAIVHHINEIKTDNRIENLQGMVRNRHISYHQTKRKRNKKNLGDRICLLCNSIDTYVNKKEGYQVWYKYKDGFICLKCYKKV